MTDRSDTELMLRVQAGDLEAFEQLVERFQTMVYGLAMSMLRRPEDAEEAAQDTFVKLFRARGSFDGERSLGPWLLRIAGNACRDKLRRRRVAELPMARSAGSTDAGDRDLLLDLPDARHGRGAANSDLMTSVRSQLDQLSDKVRRPLELKYLRGFTNQQIAEALGISVSNVKVQLGRGKDILASRLQNVHDGIGRTGSGSARSGPSSSGPSRSGPSSSGRSSSGRTGGGQTGIDEPRSGSAEA